MFKSQEFILDYTARFILFNSKHILFKRKGLGMLKDLMLPCTNLTIKTHTLTDVNRTGFSYNESD